MQNQLSVGKQLYGCNPSPSAAAWSTRLITVPRSLARTEYFCVINVFLFETLKKKKDSLVLLVLLVIWFCLIYDANLRVFSFSGFHGDPNCQIECEMRVITRNWRYWKMINVTTWWNQRNSWGLIDSAFVDFSRFAVFRLLFSSCSFWIKLQGRETGCLFLTLLQLLPLRWQQPLSWFVSLGHICVFLTADFLRATSHWKKDDRNNLDDFLIKWCPWCFVVDMTSSTVQPCSQV